jgi:hypothetical protein
MCPLGGDSEIRERPKSMLRNIDAPLGGAGAVDPETSTINAKKCQRWAPLRGAGAVDPGAFIINVKKRRRRAPWEVPEL